MLKKVLSFILCSIMTIGTMFTVMPTTANADTAESELTNLVMFRNTVTGAYLITGSGTDYGALSVSYDPEFTAAIFRTGDLTQDHLFQPYDKYLDADYDDIDTITSFSFNQAANGLYKILMNTASFGSLILAHSENSTDLSTIHVSSGYIASDAEYWELITLPENTMIRLRNVGNGKYLSHANSSMYSELELSAEGRGINTLFCIDSLSGQTSFQPFGKTFSLSYSGISLSCFSFSLNSDGTYLWTAVPTSYSIQYVGSNPLGTMSISSSTTSANLYYCWDVEIVDLALADTMIRIRNMDNGQYLSHANASGYHEIGFTSNGTDMDTVFCVGSLDGQTYLQPYHKEFTETFDYYYQEYYDQWNINYFQFVPNYNGTYLITVNATSQDTSEAWLWYINYYTAYENFDKMSWATNVDTSDEKTHWTIEAVTPTAETTVRLRNVGTGQYLSHAEATGYVSLGFTADCTGADTLFCIDTLSGQTCFQPFDREFGLYFSSYTIEYFTFSQNADGTHLWSVKPASNSTQHIIANSSGTLTYTSSTSAVNSYACWEIIKVTAP